MRRLRRLMKDLESFVISGGPSLMGNSTAYQDLLGRVQIARAMCDEAESNKMEDALAAGEKEKGKPSTSAKS